MYDAAIAVAIVSNRSPTLTTTSGFSSSNMVGSSSRPRPVDLAMVAGVSPSTIIVTRASGVKPSAWMTSTTEPNRSSSAEAPTTSCSVRSGWACDGPHHRLDAAVVGARPDEHTDFAHAESSRKASSSEAVAVIWPARAATGGPTAARTAPRLVTALRHARPDPHTGAANQLAAACGPAHPPLAQPGQRSRCQPIDGATAGSRQRQSTGHASGAHIGIDVRLRRGPARPGSPGHPRTPGVAGRSTPSGRMNERDEALRLRARRLGVRQPIGQLRDVLVERGRDAAGSRRARAAGAGSGWCPPGCRRTPGARIEHTGLPTIAASIIALVLMPTTAAGV